MILFGKGISIYDAYGFTYSFMTDQIGGCKLPCENCTKDYRMGGYGNGCLEYIFQYYKPSLNMVGD